MISFYTAMACVNVPGVSALTLVLCMHAGWSASCFASAKYSIRNSSVLALSGNTLSPTHGLHSAIAAHKGYQTIISALYDVTDTLSSFSRLPGPLSLLKTLHRDHHQDSSSRSHQCTTDVVQKEAVWCMCRHQHHIACTLQTVIFSSSRHRPMGRSTALLSHTCRSHLRQGRLARVTPSTWGMHQSKVVSRVVLHFVTPLLRNTTLNQLRTTR